MIACDLAKQIVSDSIRPGRETPWLPNGEELAAHNGQVGNPTIFIRPQDRRLHDPEVTFEEYHYYALRTRAEEKTLPPSDSEKTN